MRRFLLVLGGLAILVTSFFVTLQILNYMETQRTPAEARNAIRAEHARLLKAALEKFRAASKSYPASPDFNDISNLQHDLVGGGYLAEIPGDPQSANGKKYRYASNGNVYRPAVRTGGGAGRNAGRRDLPQPGKGRHDQLQGLCPGLPVLAGALS